MAGTLRLIDHALAQHKLSLMRDPTITAAHFRRLLQQASLILCSEMTRDLEVEEKEIISANGAKTIGHWNDQGSLVIVPILRAGLVMAESFATLLPMARTGHIGIFRDEDDEHHFYMVSLPRIEPGQIYFLLDPVIAQGETIALAVDYLLGSDIPASQIRVGCIITSAPGADRFYEREEHADIDIFAIARDPELNESNHVVPGLGNAGGRMFRTDEFDDIRGEPNEPG